MAYTINGIVTSPEDISALFSGETPESTTETTEDTNTKDKKPDDNQDEHKQEITEGSIEDIFGNNDQEDESEQDSEKVGDEGAKSEKERASSEQEQGSSPKNIHSSIANALAEDGVLSNLSEEDLNNIKDSDTLVAAMKKQVDTMLSEAQKRVQDALDAGIPTSQVQQYEGIINYLNNITEDQLSDEGNDGEELRKNIIRQYLLSRGESEDRADKMVSRAFSNGTDVEDATEYLDSLKQYYANEYKGLIEEGKKQTKLIQEKQKEDLAKVKKTLLEDKDVLGGIEVDARTRQLALDNWIKPTFKTENGVYQSKIQKFIADNPLKFQTMMALLFTMSDGFEHPEKIVGQAVKKEKKKAMKELEEVINSTQRTSSGGINFNPSDPNSSFNKLEIAPPNLWKK